MSLPSRGNRDSQLFLWISPTGASVKRSVTCAFLTSATTHRLFKFATRAVFAQVTNLREWGEWSVAILFSVLCSETTSTVALLHTLIMYPQLAKVFSERHLCLPLMLWDCRVVTPFLLAMTVGILPSADGEKFFNSSWESQWFARRKYTRAGVCVVIRTSPEIISYTLISLAPHFKGDFRPQSAPISAQSFPASVQENQVKTIPVPSCHHWLLRIDIPVRRLPFQKEIRRVFGNRPI